MLTDRRSAGQLIDAGECACWWLMGKVVAVREAGRIEPVFASLVDVESSITEAAGKGVQGFGGWRA
jgi:hypothetical protein